MEAPERDGFRAAPSGAQGAQLYQSRARRALQREVRGPFVAAATGAANFLKRWHSLDGCRSEARIGDEIAQVAKRQVCVPGRFRNGMLGAQCRSRRLVPRRDAVVENRACVRRVHSIRS